ncbi:hypothetical protein [Streptomyces sp. NPDC058142]|uniref:hypothetical protein n=1 Tax=Streptomyces sp. NPDC058142 TaxID=3346355 RepID=UPI0036E1DB77
MSVTKWQCQTCGKLIPGARDSAERTKNHWAHMKSTGHRALEPVPKGARRAGARTPASSGRQPAPGWRVRQEHRWNKLPRGARVFIRFVVLGVALVYAVNIAAKDDPPPAPKTVYCEHHVC